MLDRDYYFFFDVEGMPISVFLTRTKAEAFDLFARLYRRVWSESVELGITIEKETDVPAERWDEIHSQYITRSKPIVAPVVKPVVPKIRVNDIKKYESTGLETEKYMTRM